MTSVFAVSSPAPAFHRRRCSGGSLPSPTALWSPSPSTSCSSPPAVQCSPASQYERIEANIGEGTYGKVHKIRDLRTGRVLAVKKAKASAADRDVGGLGFTALREIKLMQAVSHPHVMGLVDVFVDGDAVHLVMEFMDGDLKKVIEDRSIFMSEAQIKCVSFQIFSGVAALHRQWFVHRDVTPANILVNFQTGVVRLSDFGCTRTVGHGDRPLTPTCTTLWYRAPELLYGARFYGQPVDVWSTGCVIGEMFTREPLFNGRGQFDMLTRVFERRGTPTEETWKNVAALPSFVEFSYHPGEPMIQLVPTGSSCAHDFLESLLSLDPKQRPSAEDVLKHEFFTSAYPESCELCRLPFVRCVAAAGG